MTETEEYSIIRLISKGHALAWPFDAYIIIYRKVSLWKRKQLRLNILLIRLKD